MKHPHLKLVAIDKADTKAENACFKVDNYYAQLETRVYAEVSGLVTLLFYCNLLMC